MLYRSARIIAARPGKEDANSVLYFFNWKTFDNTKVIVSDNEPAFRSRRLQEWAEKRNIKLRFTAPYHPAVNGLAQRAIRDIKQYISMYPSFPGGKKCSLEAAVAHHNCSYRTGLGCNNLFAATGKPPYLPADLSLGIDKNIKLTEAARTQDSASRYREKIKINSDKRQNTTLPTVDVGDFVLVKRGPSLNASYNGPFGVMKTASQQGHLKTIWYIGPTDTMEFAAIQVSSQEGCKQCLAE